MIILIVAIAIIFINKYSNGGNIETKAKISLDKIVEKSDLETANITYNVIGKKCKNEKKCDLNSNKMSNFEYVVSCKGTLTAGIDFSKVKIDVQGDTINVLIPKAKIIGEPNVDESDFKKEKFIESEDGFLIRNPITGDDISKAFDDAQNEMKKSAESDEQLLSTAQTRAKIIIEESINQFAGLSSKDYTINWEFES